MKKIMMICLLGIAMMLPALQTSAKEEAKRIVQCHLEDDILLAGSDAEDGVITKIIVTNSARQIVTIQQCGTYFCEVYLGDMPEGNYTAQVYTSLSGVHIIGFTVKGE